MAKHYAWLNTGTGEFGIEKNWPDCESKTKGVKGMRFKSFGTEKLAQDWLDSGGEYEKKTDKIKEEIKIELKELPATTIFFDAGTGGPIKGVKVRVTDKFKNPLLQKIVKKDKLTADGNLLLPEGKTNNFGELLGLFFALELALETGVKTIAGDSKLVISHWSEGNFSDKITEETKELIKDVIVLKTKFIQFGGQLVWISGAINPSDLGYHEE